LSNQSFLVGIEDCPAYRIAPGFDFTEKPACPNKFNSEQAESDDNQEQSWTWSYQHCGASKEQRQADY
jgi:hypothetical protein